MGNVHYKLVEEVCEKIGKIDCKRLITILENINTAYSVAKKGEDKIDFRSLWSPAIYNTGIDDMFAKELYIKAIALYYTLRRKPGVIKSKVLSRDMQVTEIKMQSVRVQITPMHALIFHTHNAYGTLRENDLSLNHTSTAQGKQKPKLTKDTVIRAKNKARIAINHLRKRINKKRRKR